MGGLILAKPLYIRDFDDMVVLRLRSYLVALHGTFYGHQARFVEKAIEELLDKEQHTAGAAGPPPDRRLRPQAEDKLELIRRHIKIEGFERLSYRDLEDVIEKAAGDRDHRTRVKRIKLMKQLGYVRESPEHPLVLAISQEWISSGGPPDEQSKTDDTGVLAPSGGTKEGGV
jgi:hypothetical protein